MFVVEEFSRAILAKIVEKCGTREYWEDWTQNIAHIAEQHIIRITSLVEQPGSDAQQFFQDFCQELRDDLNESVTDKDAIEMLAQHLITRPVFDALFENHPFVERNPVSVAMTEVLSVIDEAQVEREAQKLEGFYASVRRRAAGVTDLRARQNLINELYDKFFRGAFPRTTQRLGIVYTPIAIVDFIIHSVNEALEEAFGQTLSSEGVHILDPFTGTGTFITRLLQSGLVAPEDLKRKYLEEIHANEIVLLAYYIAAINIETAFHSVAGRDEYQPFTGICLTDTFALHENDDELFFYMQENTHRCEQQKNTDIRVIFGNPPYSVGQQSENDNAKNVPYTSLDQSIRSTYANQSRATLRRNLYDNYIRAIRWGSDRLGKAGVMAYVTGSAWIERAFADGMRQCLAEEFASVHVLHLRGDIRKNMLSGGQAGEGENVFGQGSMTGVAISVFVKNLEAKEQGQIFFHDIGDHLNRVQKLDRVRQSGSIRGIAQANGWTRIIPDEHGDWLDQRVTGFENYLAMGNKKDKTGSALFHNYSLGVVTNRDPWCINPSQVTLTKNIASMISFYNHEVERWQTEVANAQSNGTVPPKIDDFVSADSTKIKWSPNLKTLLRRGRTLTVEDGQFVPCMYRPFTKQWQLFSRRLNEAVNQLPSIFPNADLPNRVIAVMGKGARSGFSALMMDALPNLDTIEKCQCFPLWLYEEVETTQSDLLDEIHAGYRFYEAITDHGLQYFRSTYLSEHIMHEDIFHYVYGLLHSEDYRNRYASNLNRALPRIPLMKSVGDFRLFRDAGKRLGALHVGYESVDPYPATLDYGDRVEQLPPEQAYRVTKMKHPGTGKSKDRTTIIYNPLITLRGIPEAAWDYVVNGKPAISWVMNRQAVRTERASGIVSDANRYAIETVGDPRYPLDLLLRLITVSLETQKVVRSLPELNIE